VAVKQVKGLEIEPRMVFRKLQLSTGDVPPHGPAQNGEAAVPRPHVDRHLAKIVQAELGGGRHLGRGNNASYFTMFAFTGRDQYIEWMG